MKIAGVEISGNAPRPYVIAEIASAHEGSVSRAKEIAQAAAEADADAVKFQIWQREEGYTPDAPEYSELKEFEFSSDEWMDILTHARTLGLAVLADVDDERCLQLALQGEVDGLKIRSSNLSNPFLLVKVARTRLPILVGTGASSLEETANGVSALEEQDVKEMVLLHGFQAFPTRVEDTRLSVLRQMSERFGKLIGYADHADGGSLLAFLLPAAALGAGACVIEKHLTIGRESHASDWESSLDPPEFAQLVCQLREVWKAIDTGQDDLTDAERAYRDRFKKTIVARRDIAKGERIDEPAIAFKCAGKLGLSPDKLLFVLGKRAVVRIPVHTVISESMLK